MTNNKLNMGTDAAYALRMRLQKVKDSLNQLKKIITKHPPPNRLKKAFGKKPPQPFLELYPQNRKSD